MATTRGKGPRTRAPQDEIGGTAAPEAAASAPADASTAPGTTARARRAAPGAGTAPDRPAADAATRPRGARKPPVAGEAEAAPEAPRTRGGRKQRETYAETAARRRRAKEVDQLQADLRAFAIARPAGWDHEDWMVFLAHLKEKGHDVSDHQAVGARLERERLAVALEVIEGLGPRRVQALTDRFQTMWSMRHAEPDAVATVAGMTRPLAARVVQHMRERYS